MVLTIDNLAERYKMLPSQVLESASTFDLYVLDVSAKWLKYQHEKAEQDQQRQSINKHAPATPKLSQEQMIDMIRKVREREK